MYKQKKLHVDFLFRLYKVALKPRNSLIAPSKGQMISNCTFGVIVFTKIATKFFKNFCPSL